MARASIFSFPSPSEIAENARVWIQEKGLWWATSFTAHTVILSTVLLLLGTVVSPKKEGTEPIFEAKIDPVTVEEVEHFDLGDTSVDPTELTTDTLMLDAPTVTEQINTSDADPFEEAGGGMGSATTSFGGADGFEVKALGSGPALKGFGGLGSQGDSTKPGSGGRGEGFGSRGSGVRKAMLGHGGTKASERAVAAALNWLARHQNPNGSWSITSYEKWCKDGTCAGGKGNYDSDSAATAMALLPFLAAGQTHKSKGPYKKNIYAGLYWLTSQQKDDGDLSGTSPQVMYAHGLATITLCEAFGLSNDNAVGAPAQQAINFIAKAQNASSGGWRYLPGEVGDTSVVGWQVMAAKSGMMAGLVVPSPVIDGAHKWLKSCAQGKGGLFSYEPGGAGTPTISAVGLLCSQYLGMEKRDPAMVEGVGFLMGNMPDITARNTYYWYYATQVMHNVPGYDWDTWNRKMRKILIDTQVRKGCAEGSWDPLQPTKDAWADYGGRVMMTALSCLTLEVYYRYLPLYKLDGGGDKHKAEPDAAAAAGKKK